MATGAVSAAGLKARPKEHSGNDFQPASAPYKLISPQTGASLSGPA